LLVSVDGHPMHLQVRAPDSGGPTVVLEAGMGSFSPNWYWVQEGHARVVANAIQAVVQAASGRPLSS
jgi:hypothetical protein